MIRDSGKRIQLPGMVRDTTDGKTRYDLVMKDGPMFERWAKHLTSGAVKYAARNWMGAHTKEELERFEESAIRHFVQWLNGDTDEDHAAAVFFNINGAEYVKEKLAPISNRRGSDVDRRKCKHLSDEHYRRDTNKGRRVTDTKNYWDQAPCDE